MHGLQCDCFSLLQTAENAKHQLQRDVERWETEAGAAQDRQQWLASQLASQQDTLDQEILRLAMQCTTCDWSNMLHLQAKETAADQLQDKVEHWQAQAISAQDREQQLTSQLARQQKLHDQEILRLQVTLQLCWTVTTFKGTAIPA